MVVYSKYLYAQCFQMLSVWCFICSMLSARCFRIRQHVSYKNQAVVLIIVDYFYFEYSDKALAGRPHIFRITYGFHGANDVIFGTYTPKWHRMKCLMKHNLRQFGPGFDRTERIIEEEVASLEERFAEQNGHWFDPSLILVTSVVNALSASVSMKCRLVEDAGILFPTCVLPTNSMTNDIVLEVYTDTGAPVGRVGLILSFTRAPNVNFGSALHLQHGILCSSDHWQALPSKQHGDDVVPENDSPLLRIMLTCQRHGAGSVSMVTLPPKREFPQADCSS